MLLFSWQEEVIINIKLIMTVFKTSNQKENEKVANCPSGTITDVEFSLFLATVKVKIEISVTGWFGFIFMLSLWQILLCFSKTPCVAKKRDNYINRKLNLLVFE